jgi:hypothetical protein
MASQFRSNFELPIAGNFQLNQVFQRPDQQNYTALFDPIERDIRGMFLNIEVVINPAGVIESVSAQDPIGNYYEMVASPEDIAFIIERLREHSLFQLLTNI